MNKKITLYISILVILLVLGGVYYTHRSIPQEMTQENMELKMLLESQKMEDKTMSDNMDDKQMSESEGDMNKNLEMDKNIEPVAPIIADDKPEPVEQKQIISQTPPTPIILKSGIFNPDATDSDRFHRGWGGVQIVSFKDVNKLVFLDDFNVTNGPDYYVYLLKEKNIETESEFKRLAGKHRLTQIKQFSGYQVYNIPDNLDINPYNSVVIWCEMFGEFISSANLN